MKVKRICVVELVVNEEAEKKLKQLCNLSSKLWNEVNYARLKAWLEKKHIDFEATYREFYEKYKPLIGAVTAQTVIRKNNNAWKAFFRLLKLKREGKLPPFVTRVSPPGFGKRNRSRTLWTVIRKDQYKMNADRIVLQGLGAVGWIELRYKGPIYLRGERGELRICYDADRGKWYANIAFSEVSEKMAQTESGSRQSESDSVRREETQIVSDGRRRGEYRPRELRIRLYDRVMALRQLGLSYNKIRDVIKQEYGIELSRGQIHAWVRGLHSPYNGGRIPSLELLEPSEDLAYVIGAVCGDGYVGLERRDRKGYRQARIHLRAKDKEFVEEFAIRIGRVLNRSPHKPKILRSAGRYYYYTQVRSKTLYELLKKPVDLERLRKYIEHCDKCIAAFLRGFFDAEGGVLKDGSIYVVNSDYRLLKYVQSLLGRFKIATTDPNFLHQRGSIIHMNERQYIRRRDVYYIYVKQSCNMRFYKHIGFTIKRKQERLVNHLIRTGKLEY